MLGQQGPGGLGGAWAQVGKHGVDVVVVCQRGEVGAERKVDGIVGAAVVIQLGARRYQP